LIIFLEIKQIKRPAQVESLQGLALDLAPGLWFQRRFSANYFQTAFALLAEGRHGEGV
jgi:hypothetical protein